MRQGEPDFGLGPRWPQISAYQALRGKDQSVSFPVCHKRIHGPSAHDPVCGCEDGLRPRPAGLCWPCTQMLRSCQQAVKKDLNLLIFSAFPPTKGHGLRRPLGLHTCMGQRAGLEWFETRGGFSCSETCLEGSGQCACCLQAHGITVSLTFGLSWGLPRSCFSIKIEAPLRVPGLRALGWRSVWVASKMVFGGTIL